MAGNAYTNVTRSRHKTLNATFADTITFNSSPRKVLVQNRGASGDIFARGDGTPAAVNGDDSYCIPPGQAGEIDIPDSDGTRYSATPTPAVVTVICSTGNAYSVTAV